MNIKINGIIITSIFLLCACGGPKPAPRDPGDETGGGGGSGGGAAIPDGLPKVQPKRKVSKAAKVEFAEAAKAYKAAKKSGGVTKANCESLASAFSSIFQSHPKIAEAKFNAGVIYEECGEVRKAEQAYRELLRKHAGFGPALNNLGQIFFTRGQVSDAVTYFRKATAAKTSEGYSNMAVIQRNRAKGGEIQLVKEAINNVHRALAVDAFNIEAYGTLALVLYDHAKTKSQLEMARLICVQATKVEPDYAPVYNTLGLILLRQRNVTAALAKFRKTVALDQNFLQAHMNIGAITLSFRDYKSAEEAFSKVLTLNPSKKDKLDALVGLGVALRGQRKFTEAMTKYKQAKAQDPTKASISYNMGILVQDYLFDASNPAKAIQDLSRAKNLLQNYVTNGRSTKVKKDCNRRIKNINDLIPMLREQQKMMKEMQQGKSS